jgi:hypothetical protein
MTTPPRHGQPWTDDEVQKLLQGIKQKNSIFKIATDHERTTGSIRGKLKQLAADYYFNDNRQIEEIAKFTGLDFETITDAISKRQYEMDMKEKKAAVKPLLQQTTIPQIIQQTEQKKEGMVSLLTEIRDMMKEMLEIMKKDTS